MAIDPVDLYVGERLRIRRNQLGISQEDLGKNIGVTFQQIQKYESGKNRIASGRLHQLAKQLNCDANYFFEGYEDESVTLNHSEQLIYEKEYLKIRDDFCSLPIKMQKGFGNIIREVAKQGNEN